MAEESTAQKGIIERVLHAFKIGDLKRNDGETVENPKQAVAIALHEAGASNQETPATNRKNLARTKRREKAAAPAGDSKAALYAEAKKRNIAGRSKMSKDELAEALRA